VFQVIVYRLKGESEQDSYRNKMVLISHRLLTSYTLIITTWHTAFFNLIL